MTVWIVSLEWNHPPSEVTGDTGISGVFTTKEAAEREAVVERATFDSDGDSVYQFSIVAGRYCAACGEVLDGQHDTHVCAMSPETVAFCDYCGAELKADGECDNDHDEWDIDVHVTEHTVQGPS